VTGLCYHGFQQARGSRLTCLGSTTVRHFRATMWTLTPQDEGCGGWVYFLDAVSGRFCEPYVKVGATTRTPEERLNQIRRHSTAFWYRLGLVGAVRVYSDPLIVEAALHEVLRAFHKGREWFAKNAALDVLQALESVQEKCQRWPWGDLYLDPLEALVADAVETRLRAALSRTGVA